jgi:hypothetical protein
MSNSKRAAVTGGRPPRKDPLASLKMASMMDTKPVLPAGNEQHDHEACVGICLIVARDNRSYRRLSHRA